MRSDQAIEAQQIQIFGEDDGPWQLSIVLTIQRIHATHQVRVGLDRSMYAIPPPLPSPRTVTRALQVSGTLPVPIAASRASSTTHASYRVSNGGACVVLTIAREAHNGVYGVTIPFEFRPAVIPDRLTIDLAVHHRGRRPERFAFQGMYVGAPHSVRANLIDFLAEPGQRFLFSGTHDELRLPYGLLSPVLPRVQLMPDSTVWGTTWPHEVSFWDSPPGLDFLAHQVVGLHARGAVPRRIAVAPNGPGVSSRLAEQFLAELDVQATLGVDIRIVELEDLLAGRTGQRALLCIGSSLGVLYSGVEAAGIAEPQASLIVGDDVATLRALYDPLQLEGVPYAEYRRAHPRAAAMDLYIRRRLLAVRGRAAALSARRAGVGGLSAQGVSRSRRPAYAVSVPSLSSARYAS